MEPVDPVPTGPMPTTRIITTEPGPHAVPVVNLPGSSRAASLRRSYDQPIKEGKKEKDPSDGVHIHGMWFHPNSQGRIQAQDRNFLENLRNAHATMMNVTRELPSNVDAHLWTDRKSRRALFAQTYRSDKFEPEIPLSMMMNSQVKVHLAEEIETLISEFDGPNKKTLEALFNHPANINIGFRSDIVRLLYGILFSGKNTEDEKRDDAEFNIHLDIDVMHQAEKAKKEKALLGSAVKTSIEAIRIPEALRSDGYGLLSKENNVIGMRPRHEKAIRTAELTLALLNDGSKAKFEELLTSFGYHSYIKSMAFDMFDNGMRKHGEKLQEWHLKNTGPKSRDLDQENLLDYFRLAEKIRQLKPKWQAQIDYLANIIENTNPSEEEKAFAQLEIKAIKDVFETCGEFIKAYVNKHSYLPQVAFVPETSAPEFEQTASGFKNLLKPIFGDVEFDRIHTFTNSDGSWQAGTLSFDSKKLGMDDMMFDLDLRPDVFEHMHKTTGPSTTDDLHIL